MTIRGKALIVGVYEHPRREIADRSVMQIHAEVAAGALADAGLSFSDVDGYCGDSTVPGLGPMSIVEYLGLRCKYVDSTDVGGSAPVVHVGHSAAAIAAGKCHVVLITLAGRMRGMPRRQYHLGTPEAGFELPWGLDMAPHNYALGARRHMYEFGTTGEDLAWVKVAASQHAQYNPNALLQNPVTVEEVLDSPMIADPLHRLDCCVITDGGGAVVVVSPEVARELPRAKAIVLGHGEAPKGTNNGRVDVTYTGALWSGPQAFEQAGVRPRDIDYASIYDSFTITVLVTIEDLGFCEKGQGGAFVRDGGLVSPHGRLPFNTDGGGLCNNHPSNRGGVTKIIEAVRQLRGEAHPAVQVPDCELVLAHGTGGSLSTRMGSSTLILGRES